MKYKLIKAPTLSSSRMYSASMRSAWLPKEEEERRWCPDRTRAVALLPAPLDSVSVGLRREGRQGEGRAECSVEGRLAVPETWVDRLARMHSEGGAPEVVHSGQGGCSRGKGGGGGGVPKTMAHTFAAPGCRAQWSRRESARGTARF